ncbi:hypothetical protein HGM15179_006317 [Zosterops borbonicus]|uniref:Ig-like domain-containing protein n=1 Tax=Zosterops borbonicus TaxID=364589 RepID=A0A8K1LNU4_9PASS|nr:hypothetical protein HGM15179_006317 [Zosterops borbonicus]
MGQGFSLQQPQDKVLVAAGETITLNCTMSQIPGPGPVKWLKGWGSGNKTIYDQGGNSLPRVTRAVPESNTDFTIHIRKAQPEDMGTYYCVKFAKSDSGVDEVSQHGNGTEVSVYVPPSVGMRTEPGLVEVNKTVTFTCLLTEFYPANVSVSWLENGIGIKVENISRPSELSQGLFELRSQVEVQATEEKNGSKITCMVVHDAQPPANYSAFLWISNPGQGGLSATSRSRFLLLLWVGMLLEKGLLGGLLFFLFNRMKIKASEMLPNPAPSQSLAPRAGSQGLATASSDM